MVRSIHCKVSELLGLYEYFYQLCDHLIMRHTAFLTLPDIQVIFSARVEYFILLVIKITTMSLYFR
jgi:hypothetical protein